MASHWLLNSMVSEKLGVILLRIPCTWKESLFFCCFQDSLSTLNYNVSECGSLCLSFWEFAELLRYADSWLLWNLGSFLAIISSNIFCSPYLFFLLSFWNSLSVYIGMLGGAPKVLQAVFSFLYSFFFLLLRLDHFNWHVFKNCRFFLLPAQICHG